MSVNLTYQSSQEGSWAGTLLFDQHQRSIRVSIFSQEIVVGLLMNIGKLYLWHEIGHGVLTLIKFKLTKYGSQAVQASKQAKPSCIFSMLDERADPARYPALIPTGKILKPLRNCLNQQNCLQPL